MRIVLKVSGEALKNENGSISVEMLEKVKGDIKCLRDKGNEVFVVVGGGNFWRGRENLSLDTAITNNIGMLATVMNALALTSYLNNNGVSASIFSSFEIEGIAHKFNYIEALEVLKSNVIVLGGGLGVPTFSTDMVTVEKAVELNADLIIMAKSVDGIYDKDPKIESAKKYEMLTHEELIRNQINAGFDKLGVMDLEAMSLLCKNKVPVYVFSALDEDGIVKYLNGEGTGTLVES